MRVRPRGPGAHAVQGPEQSTIAFERVGLTLGGTRILEDVTLAVAPGEIHALIGANGAGKTTLLRVAAGLVGVGSGRVSVAGSDPATFPRALRGVVGFVSSSDRSFYLRISGFENLCFFARLHGLHQTHATQRAREALASVDLAPVGDHTVATYSHGMLRRLALARALLAEPQVLLVDEVTHDLDPGAAERARALVEAAAARGAAVLWATQRLEELDGFAERVSVLEGGRRVFTGALDELAAPTAELTAWAAS